MTDDDLGPLVRTLRQSADWFPRSTDLRQPAQLAHTDSVLFGRRGLYRPNVAIHTFQRLGPARHAIAQRTVAGVIEIHAPFAPKTDKSTTDSKSGVKRPPGPAPRR